MSEYKCKKCGTEKFYIRDVEKLRGLYCHECGYFLKWSTKAEIYYLISKGIIKSTL